MQINQGEEKTWKRILGFPLARYTSGFTDSPIDRHRERAKAICHWWSLLHPVIRFSILRPGLLHLPAALSHRPDHQRTQCHRWFLYHGGRPDTKCLVEGRLHHFSVIRCSWAKCHMENIDCYSNFRVLDITFHVIYIMSDVNVFSGKYVTFNFNVLQKYLPDFAWLAFE